MLEHKIQVKLMLGLANCTPRIVCFDWHGHLENSLLDLCEISFIINGPDDNSNSSRNYVSAAEQQPWNTRHKREMLWSRVNLHKVKNFVSFDYVFSLILNSGILQLGIKEISHYQNGFTGGDCYN